MNKRDVWKTYAYGGFYIEDSKLKFLKESEHKRINEMGP